MKNLLRAIGRRGIAFGLVFILAVSVVMVRVYYLHDDELGSDPLDASSVREEILFHWRAPYSFKISLPPKDDLTENWYRYPFPLRLIVSVDEQRRLFLNNEEIGTLADTSMLRKRLSDLFLQREVTGAYRTGMDPRTGLQRVKKIEKSVRVDMPHTFKYGEVVELIDAIKAAGADPIELQIDGRVDRERFNVIVQDAISGR